MKSQINIKWKLVTGENNCSRSNVEKVIVNDTVLQTKIVKNQRKLDTKFKKYLFKSSVQLLGQFWLQSIDWVWTILLGWTGSSNLLLTTSI